MTTHHIWLSVLMFATGVGIPIMATMNGALGLRLGSPSAASVILFFLAFSIAIIATLITGVPESSKIISAPKLLMLAGCFVAFYIISITTVGPIIGIGQAVFLVLLGQIISTVVIDHYGWLGVPVTPVEPRKVIGIVLMIAGIYLSRRV